MIDPPRPQRTAEASGSTGNRRVSSERCRAAERDQAVAALRQVGSEFHRRSWSLGTSSNYSIVLSRDPLELLVTASGKDKGKLGSDDFVHVDQRGQPTVPGQPKSSAETMLHVVLAQDPSVGAILHTHSIWATLLSDWFCPQGSLVLEGYEMLKGLAGVATHEYRETVPVFENTQDIPGLAAQVQVRLRDRNGPSPHGFLIRRHGLYTWGCDVWEARRHVEIFEFLFECLGRQLTRKG
jgi:methylthioribulose-1-phosphate dehydratase